MNFKTKTLILFLSICVAFFSVDAQKQTGVNFTGTTNSDKVKPQILNTNDANTQILNGNLSRCGIDAILEQIYNDPTLLKQYEENKNPLPQSQFINNRITCNANNTVNIPLAFHFDNSFGCGNEACILSEIQDAITTLNNDFGNNTGSPNAANCPAAYPDISTGTCINFYLAAPPACSGLDPACDGAITIGQFQGGYNGGGSGAGNCWDDYLNVFIQSAQAGNLGVADQIPGYLGAQGPGEGVSLGGPYFGGTGGACAPLDTDGTYNRGGTLAHEIGHYLGLPHIWGDVNGGGCGGDDGFADTPNQANSFGGCPNGCINSGCGGSQQTANFMNYTQDACMDLFTEDQAATMNFYANQFFGNLNIPAADPPELYSQCTGNACSVVCATQVTSQYNDTETICYAQGTYTLPTTYAGLAVDNPQSVTYAWSTGAYISSGGTQVNTTTVNLTQPTGCAPITQTLYLNVGCSDGSINLNAGTMVLTVFPDPTQLNTADIVSFTNGGCDGPNFTIVPGCASYATVTQNGGPNFPVTSGSGTVNYDISLNYPVDCCATQGAEILLTGSIGSTTLNNGNADQNCQNGTQPAIWNIAFTIPPAQNASNVNTTGLGAIKEVCIDLTMQNTDVLNITLDSPDCAQYEWEDLWLGSAFQGGSNTGPISNLCFTPGNANGEFDGTFDGDGNAQGAGSFNTCDVNTNQWTLYIADYNCYLNGGTGGTLNSATVVFCDGFQQGNAGLCDFTATASYNCTATCASVDLGIFFDNAPNQTSWDITDVSGTVVASSGGTYGTQAGNSTLNSNAACLPDGCYNLNFYDTFNNGMCPFQSSAIGISTFITPGTLITPGSIVGTLSLVATTGLCGNYTLTDANGATLVSGGGQFGAQETNNFCLVNGVAPRVTSPANQDLVSKDFNEFVFEINPTVTTDFITVSYKEGTNGQLRVLDLSGKTLQEFTISNNGILNNLRIDVSTYETGVFMVQLVNNIGEVNTKKFLKQ